MNDSFLEDLKLVPSDTEQVTYPVDRHVTTRTATSSPIHQISEIRLENLAQRKPERSSLTDKHTGVKESSAKDLKKQVETDAKRLQSKGKVVDRREKPVESKLKPIENKVKTDSKGAEVKDDIKKKIQETKVRIAENKVIVKDRSRRSGSCKDTHALDVSSKENRPSNSPKESTSQIERGRKYDSNKKSDVKESDPIVMLNAIKDIVSTYTKQESSKILKVMQELHLNSQATLIKNLLYQTDDIVKEIHPSRDSARMKSLVEHNQRLEEDLIMLQKANADLQKKLEEFEAIKHENIALKLKFKELLK